MPPSLEDYIEHILTAIGRIFTYTHDVDRELFATGGLIHDAGNVVVDSQHLVSSFTRSR